MQEGSKGLPTHAKELLISFCTDQWVPDERKRLCLLLAYGYKILDTHAQLKYM